MFLFVPSPSIKATLWITLFLVVLLIAVGIKLKKYKYTDTPRGLILILEWLVDSVNNLCKDISGKPYKKIAPYITTLAIFLFTANISGLFGFTPPTASLSVTLALGILTFVISQFAGMRSLGAGGYIKSYFEPNPLFLPFNIIGMVANPISISLRLFANILSGTVIMSLVYAILNYLAIGVAPLLHCYFDIFVGFIQTLVFCTLSVVFIADKLSPEDLDYYDTRKESF